MGTTRNYPRAGEESLSCIPGLKFKIAGGVNFYIYNLNAYNVKGDKNIAVKSTGTVQRLELIDMMDMGPPDTPEGSCTPCQVGKVPECVERQPGLMGHLEAHGRGAEPVSPSPWPGACTPSTRQGCRGWGGPRGKPSV